MLLIVSLSGNSTGIALSYTVKLGRILLLVEILAKDVLLIVNFVFVDGRLQGFLSWHAIGNWTRHLVFLDCPDGEAWPQAYWSAAIH